MRKSICLLLSFYFILLQVSYGQNSGVTIRRADRYYNDFDFVTALDIYKKAHDKDGKNLYVQGRIGNCYRFLNQIQESEDWYEDLANAKGIDPIYKFYYAQALMSNGKYPEALRYYNAYYEAIGKPELKEFAYPELMFEEDDRFEVQIADFNTKHADFSPYVVHNQIYFVSNRKEDAFLVRDDVWSDRPFTQIFRMEEPDSSSKSSPSVFQKKDVSMKYHEGPIGIDRNFNDMYITRSNYVGNKVVKGKDNIVNLKILKLAFDPVINDFGTQLVDNIAFNSNDYSIAYPTISVDGNYMIFSSDMPGGHGGLDLYVCENVGGIWTNPINLGDNINTPGNECFPYIMPNGTLFFASNGRLGLGGLDMYKTPLLESGIFGDPVNMRAPVNSQYDDFGFYIDDRHYEGFYSSNRPEGYGDDDIYQFTMTAFQFEAFVFDTKTNASIDSAVFTLTNLDDGEEVVFYSDELGAASVDVMPNSRYKLSIRKDGFLEETAEFNTGEEDVYAEIGMIEDFGIILNVSILDIDSKSPLEGAKVVLVDKETGEEFTNATDNKGKVTFSLDPDRQYVVHADKALDSEREDYLAVSNEFNTLGTKAPANLYAMIELQKRELKEVIEIKDIYYDVDKYYIRDDAALELDKLVKLLLDNPTMEIELSSHTDCRGSAKYNMWLSGKRAESAVSYLILQGVGYRRLTAAGYGETRLKNNCACENKSGIGLNCSEEEHQQNRRTEFTILKF